MRTETTVHCAHCGRKIDPDSETVQATMWGETFCLPCWRALRAQYEREDEQDA